MRRHPSKRARYMLSTALVVSAAGCAADAPNSEDRQRAPEALDPCALPVGESPYIFGIHEPGGEGIMADKGKKGWIVFTEAVGADPQNAAGRDYHEWADAGYGVIVRLNNGYGTEGTLPCDDRYGDFAQRVSNFVNASRGPHIWILGNE